MPVMAGVLFGSAGTFIRVLQEAQFNTVTIVAQRAVFAAVFLALILPLYDKEILKIRLKDLWLFALSGVCGITVMNLCYNIAMKELTMSFAAVLLSVFPVFVLLFSAVLFKEKITLKKGICCVLAVIGCYMVSEMPGITGTFQFSKTGIIMGVLTPLFYSFYSIGSGLAMERGYKALTITFYSIVMMAIVSTPFADWKLVMNFASENIVSNGIILILHAVCVAVLPYMLFTIGIQHIDTGKASILSSCEPASAMLFGAVLFNEIPAGISIAGLLVTTIAICVMCMPDMRR